MLIREAMTARAEWIEPNVTLADAARKMRDWHIGCLPVGHNDRLIGMLTDRDVVCRGVAEGADPKSTCAGDVMTKGIEWCFEEDDLDEVMQRMETRQIHHMPVLNRDKRMVGILSLSDVARRAPAELFARLSALTARDSRRPMTH